MFNVGMPELVVILAVALIVLGPKRLPEVARALGKAMAEFRKATSGLTQELDNARAMLEEEARRAAEPLPKIAPASGIEPKSAPGASTHATSPPSPDGPPTATS
ncbi:MAG: Sec-independent protein translocase protein TatB [Candidatus Binatia bacterium]|jgi:sec-independent protein translocase protein TatB